MHVRKIAVVGLAVLCVTSVARGELLDNPGFEEDFTDWIAWGSGSGSGTGGYWADYSGAFFSATVVTDDNPHGGNKHAQVVFDTPDASYWGWGYCLAVQDIPVVAGETYTMSGWVRDALPDGSTNAVWGRTEFVWKYDNGLVAFGERPFRFDANSDGNIGGEGDLDRTSFFVPRNTGTNWTLVSKTGVVPPGADYLSCSFGILYGNTTNWPANGTNSTYFPPGATTMDIDDCRVVQVPTKITAAEAGSFSVSWNSVSNQTVDIEYTDDAVTWTNLVSGLVATGLVSTYVDPGPLPDARSYRVIRPSAELTELYSDPVDSGSTGWTTGSDTGTNTSWELGTPSVVGPSNAYSGSHCWGTDLDDNYIDPGGLGESIWLRSPVIDLTGVTTNTGAYLSFWNWRELDDTFTVAKVNILDESGTALASDYISMDSSETRAWSRWLLGLPPEALDQRIRVEFSLEPDGFGPGDLAGFYIDELAVYLGNGP